MVAFGIEWKLPAPPTAQGRELGAFLFSDAGHHFLSGNRGRFAILARSVLILGVTLALELR